ncbi:cupredoxin domain-containing protein [Candidatus Azambacteria bacterium]|nr:cupredoxin domain-containing protein [Candidatus Azambacteria bacterium]
MNKRLAFLVVIFIIILAVAYFASNRSDRDDTQTTTVTPKKEETKSQNANVKEFSMNSFVEVAGGVFKPQFSVKEISAKKGDVVKINVTDTNGTHNFNIDEFNVHKETPLNETVTIEFTADKAGEFIYYCSKPGHRAAGQWGTLKVSE